MLCALPLHVRAVPKDLSLSSQHQTLRVEIADVCEEEMIAVVFPANDEFSHCYRVRNPDP
jgi:hypothetical protein